jgi:hypothetical protein
MMIPTVDLTDYSKLYEQRRKHPLFKRRAEINQSFLDDLTRLTRKYGLELHITTRNEYGESYPDCELKAPYQKGTNARYVFSEYNGIDFENVNAKEALPCSTEERKQYEAAVAERNAEDDLLWTLNREINDAYCKAMEKGRTEMFARHMEEMKTRKPPTSFLCSCGAKFKTDAKRNKHREDTGHA